MSEDSLEIRPSGVENPAIAGIKDAMVEIIKLDRENGPTAVDIAIGEQRTIWTARAIASEAPVDEDFEEDVLTRFWSDVSIQVAEQASPGKTMSLIAKARRSLKSVGDLDGPGIDALSEIPTTARNEVGFK